MVGPTMNLISEGVCIYGTLEVYNNFPKKIFLTSWKITLIMIILYKSFIIAKMQFFLSLTKIHVYLVCPLCGVYNEHWVLNPSVVMWLFSIENDLEYFLGINCHDSRKY